MAAEKIKVRVGNDPVTHEVNTIAFSAASKVFADMTQLTDDGVKSDEIRLDISPEMFPHVVEFVERRHSKETCGHPDHGEMEDKNMKTMCMLDKAFIRKFSSREVLLLSQVRVTFSRESSPVSGNRFVGTGMHEDHDVPNGRPNYWDDAERAIIEE